MRPHTSAPTRVTTYPSLAGALVLGLVMALVMALGLALTTAPAHAQRINPDYFGMHDKDWTSFPSQPVGSANFTTTGSYWPAIERTKGAYTWHLLDAQVEAAEAHGAQPMAVIGFTPDFWSTARRNRDRDRTDMPDMKAWKRYVTRLVLRYGARLDYQIWPEPNIVQNWTGTMPQLAKLTAVASSVINSVSPGAKVVGPAMTLRLRSQRTMMLKFYKQSVGGKRVHRYLDAIAIDAFPVQEGLPEDAYSLMRKAKKMLARVGVKRVPFWNNEINYGVAGGGNPTGTTYPVKLQQSFVVRSYLLGAAAQMARTYWLGWFSTDTMGVQMADDEGNQLPPGRSYGVVRGWMLGSSFQGCTTLSSGVWTCTMVSGNEVRRVYWRPTGSAMVTLPSTRTRLETQDGAVVVAPPSSVRVDHAPVMVASLR